MSPEYAHRVADSVERVFRAELLLEPREKLPMDETFADLGLPSFRLARVKRELERVLETRIDTSRLYNAQTIGTLIRYLTEGDDWSAGSDSGDPVLRSLFQEELQSLYQPRER